MTYCGYFSDVSARDAETKDNLLTAGQNGLNIMRRNLYSFKSKMIHVLLGFACPIFYVTISIPLGSKCTRFGHVACFLNRNSRLTRQKWKQNAESDSDHRALHQSAHYLMVTWKGCEEATFPQAFDLTAMWDCVDWWDDDLSLNASVEMNLISLT